MVRMQSRTGAHSLGWTAWASPFSRWTAWASPRTFLLRLKVKASSLWAVPDDDDAGQLWRQHAPCPARSPPNGPEGPPGARYCRPSLACGAPPQKMMWQARGKPLAEHKFFSSLSTSHNDCCQAWAYMLPSASKTPIPEFVGGRGLFRPQGALHGRRLPAKDFVIHGAEGK